MLLLALSAALIALFTLLPARLDPTAPVVSFWCVLGCGWEELRDLLSNVVLFVPLGWSLRAGRRTTRVVQISLAVSVLIELLQATVIPGRDSSLRDIIGNSAGGALGAWLYASWGWLRWPDRARGLRLGGLAVTAWLLLLLLSGLGVGPAPTASLWYGAWAPDLGHYTRYPGQVLSIDLAGVIPETGPLTAADRIRRAIAASRFEIDIRAVSGAQPPGPAPIFLITDGIKADQLFVGQDRRALWLHVRNRFEAWGLRGLVLRLPLFPGRSPGDTVRIQAGASGNSLFLRSTTRDSTAEVELPLTAGLGWYGLLPMRYPLWHEWLVLSPLWLAGLALPLGYWLGRAARAGALLLIPGALATGLLATPVLTGAAPARPVEWFGALLGGALGWGTGVWSRRRHPSDPSPRQPHGAPVP